RAHLETRTYPNRDELRQYVHCLEILRDAGGETAEELMICRSQAATTVHYWRHDGNKVALAHAVHAYGNICRLTGDKRTAWRMTRLALDLLHGHRGPLSSNQRLVLHQ